MEMESQLSVLFGSTMHFRDHHVPINYSVHCELKHCYHFVLLVRYPVDSVSTIHVYRICIQVQIYKAKLDWIYEITFTNMELMIVTWLSVDWIVEQSSLKMWLLTSKLTAKSISRKSAFIRLVKGGKILLFEWIESLMTVTERRMKWNKNE